MANTHAVYVKTDERGVLTQVGSSAFLTDLDGWTLFDEGAGDRYFHAQGNYLPLPLTDERGVFRYKVENGQIVARADDEMDAEAVFTPENGMDEVRQRLAALEMQLSGYEAAYREGVENA